MKIQVMSDIHLEFAGHSIRNENDAEVLVLAGDIVVAETLRKNPEQGNNARADRYRSFFGLCSRQYDHVVFVAGNHEFYSGKWNQTLDVLRHECSHFTNVHFLEQNFVEISGVVFVGGTLWSDFNDGDPLTKMHVQSVMNDFRKITDDTSSYRRITPTTMELRHSHTRDYIREVSGMFDKVVAVTHHSPSFRSVAPKFKNQALTNGAYHSDLSDLILDRESIKLWIHGHTHDAVDYEIGQCRVVCNPKGYPGENDEFNNSFTMEI